MALSRVLLGKSCIGPYACVALTFYLLDALDCVAWCGVCRWYFVLSSFLFAVVFRIFTMLATRFLSHLKR